MEISHNNSNHSLMSDDLASMQESFSSQLSLNTSMAIEQDKLLKVIVVSRHGIRNPKRLPEQWNFHCEPSQMGKLS